MWVNLRGHKILQCWLSMWGLPFKVPSHNDVYFWTFKGCCQVDLKLVKVASEIDA